MNGKVEREMTKARMEARTAPKAASLIGTVTKTKEALEAKRHKASAKARATVKPDTATISESKDTSE